MVNHFVHVLWSNQDSGMFKVVKELQAKKALSPISRMLSGMLSFSKAEQPLKALPGLPGVRAKWTADSLQDIWTSGVNSKFDVD